MPTSMRRTLALLLAVICLAGGGVLTWRIAVVSERAGRGKQTSIEQILKDKRGKKKSGEKRAAPRTGITGVTLKYFDPDDGRLVLIVKAARGDTKGNVCKLEDVKLERRLGDGKGLLLASSKTGTYDRKTGSGNLQGNVLVERLPARGKKPDVTIRGQTLRWTRGAEMLTSEDYVEMSWMNPAEGRMLSARGLGLRADRWAQNVRLREDVCVTVTGSALPSGLDFGADARAGAERQQKNKGPVRTVITSEGSAVLEYDSDAGRHRARFTRQVVVKVRQMTGKAMACDMKCDELEMFFRSAGAIGRRESPVLAAGSAAAAAPVALAATSRWLAATLGGEVPGRAARRKGAVGVDLVVARGSVVISAAQGVARGELAWYDHPAGLLWLEGKGEETAELVRESEGQQTLARRFFYNVRTGDMRVPKGDRITVIIE
jgi:hypothetical protein